MFNDFQNTLEEKKKKEKPGAVEPLQDSSQTQNMKLNHDDGGMSIM